MMCIRKQIIKQLSCFQQDVLHVKPVVMHVVLACCGKGAELQQRNMPCFVSLIFHVLTKKTGWESGAVSALFVLYLVL